MNNPQATIVDRNTSTAAPRSSGVARLAALALCGLVLAACDDASSSADDTVEGDAQLTAGRAAFQVCSSCHVVDEERHRAGPHLVDLFGREAGGTTGFRYSGVLANSGIVWDEETLDAFLANPRGMIPGNRMAFAGIRDADEREALIAWLRVATSDD